MWISPTDIMAECPDGSEPVNCFVAPCDVSSCPAYPDATCIDNYCGGCNAEYFDEYGERVHCSGMLLLS